MTANTGVAPTSHPPILPTRKARGRRGRRVPSSCWPRRRRPMAAGLYDLSLLGCISSLFVPCESVEFLHVELLSYVVGGAATSRPTRSLQGVDPSLQGVEPQQAPVPPAADRASWPSPRHRPTNGPSSNQPIQMCKFSRDFNL